MVLVVVVLIGAILAGDEKQIKVIIQVEVEVAALVVLNYLNDNQFEAALMLLTYSFIP